VVKAPAHVRPFYIVEQGPVYGGPHIVTNADIRSFSHAAHALSGDAADPTYRDPYLLPPWHKPWQNSRP